MIRCIRVVVLLTLTVLPAVAQFGQVQIAPPCNAPPSSMVAWWPLDERSGSRIDDLRAANDAEANDKIGQGGPAVDPYPVDGGALFFDGVDDAIYVPSRPAIDFGLGDFSIQLWLRAEPTSGVTTILDKREGTYHGYSVFLYFNQPGLQLADGGYSNYVAPINVADNRWHHLVISVARTANAAVRFYVDGRSVYENHNPRLGSLANNAPLLIAEHAYSHYHFRGALDEIALYDRALTGSELGELSAGSLWIPLCKPTALPPTASKCGGTSPAMADEYVYEGEQIILKPAPHERYLLVQAPNDPNGEAARRTLERAGLTNFELERIGSLLYPETSDLFLAGFHLPPDTVTSVIENVLLESGPIVHIARVYPDGHGGWSAPLASVFVEFRPGLSDAERQQLVASAGMSIRESEADDDVVELAPVAPLANTVCQSNLLVASGKVVFAEPNFWERVAATTDPLFPKQWGLKNTGQAVCNAVGKPGADANVVGAWPTSTGSGIRIAIVDVGVQRDHPDLDVVDGKDFWDSGNGGPTTAYDNHGTACAGIAAARGNNGTGGQGVAYGAQIVSAKFANGTADGSLDTSNRAMRRAIKWAWKDAGAQVLSNSWGGGAKSFAVKLALRRAKREGRGGKGAVILFASGNNDGEMNWQSQLDEVIGVGASSPCDERKSPASCDGEQWGSNYGAELDVVAPGVKMLTTDRTGSDGYVAGDYTECFNGTSSATPFAAGVAALVLALNGNRTSDEIETILERSADDIGSPGFDEQTGYGRVNAARAMGLASCALSGDESAFFSLASGARYRVFRFIPGQIFVSAGRTLLKIKDTGGTGQNMFALDVSTLAGLPGYNHWMGTQVFPATIRDVAYVNGTTMVGLADGRLVKVSGTGGTGQNMFGINVDSSGFTGVRGSGSYIGSDRFNSGIRLIVPLGGDTLLAFDNGKTLKVNGSCGSGFNLCAVTETSSGFDPVPNYPYYVGEFRFQAALTVAEKIGGQLLLGFANGKMLKISNNGGTGHNMFAITETSSGFNGLQNYPYYLGDARFNAAPTTLTAADSVTLIGFANGKMLKVVGTGGTGHNMFAVTESSSDISGLNNYSYYVGDQSFSAPPRAVLYRGTETLIGLGDGRLLKVTNSGGTGHNMFAVHEVSNGFESETGYHYLTGSANFNESVTSLNFIDGQMFLGTARGGLLKVNGTGGSGYNVLAIARSGACFEGLCGYSYYLGCQDLSDSLFQ